MLVYDLACRVKQTIPFDRQRVLAMIGPDHAKEPRFFFAYGE